MKGLSIEQKAALYDDVIERAKSYLNDCPDRVDAKGCIEYLLPSLKESKDEAIKKALIHLINEQYGFLTAINGISVKDILDWLEKQGKGDMGISESTKQELEDNLNKALEKETPESWNKFFDGQGKQKPIMIQWQGNNLKEVIDFVGKDKNFEKWFKSFEEYEKYVNDHNGIFKLFNADGSHYEIPVGAWIVKTPDGCNVASKAKYKQKHTDKVEPKFHEGDWVVDNCGYVWKIAGTVNQFYILEGVEGGESRPTIEWVDKTFHLWTIQDAKDGDVLCYKDEISLYKHDIKNCTKQGITFGGFVYHCCYDGKRFITDSLYSLTEQDKTDVHPATQEQRDILFAKMKEAGYEWDVDKKKLEKDEIKIKAGRYYRCTKAHIYAGLDWPEGSKYYADEDYSLVNNECTCFCPKYGKYEHNNLFEEVECEQNPAWSEEDEKMYNRIYDLIHAAAYANYDVDEDGKELGGYAKMTNWFKSIKDRVQPKQEWSEEDENISVAIKEHLREYYVDKKGYPYVTDKNSQEMKESRWLKSIKDRVQPQSKLDWSVEDYNEIETIACYLDNIDNEGMAEVLRYIRDKYYHTIPQPTWKPSDKQMKAIEHICNGCFNVDLDILDSIYKDFKKLREE